MDAAWKVYVGDRRFDDDQISNCFLKLKYETVGRFTFDFRPMDGDESYMQNGRTLRIFWGDLHKLDGVIQRVDWDSKQFCYHVYGADIRGFLLDRVNTEPATVSSYTSDVTSQVMFTGCDFPTNIWTGAGESIGKYTFHYKIGIQNTIRIMGPEFRWVTVTERGTVYAHVDGCLYDATKNWVPGVLAGATLRFVSGACKNNVYNINGNSSNRVCIRLPGESAADYATVTANWKQVGTQWYNNLLPNPDFETGTIDPWRGVMEYPELGWGSHHYVTTVAPASSSLPLDFGTKCARIFAETIGMTTYGHTSLDTGTTPPMLGVGDIVEFAYRWTTTAIDDKKGHAWILVLGASTSGFLDTNHEKHNPAWPDWDIATHNIVANSGKIQFSVEAPQGGQTYMDIDNVRAWSATSGSPIFGKIPGCSRIGDIYEIVFASMERIEPASLAPATLEKDNHIIRYNRVNSLSDHVTSMTIRGT